MKEMSEFQMGECRTSALRATKVGTAKERRIGDLTFMAPMPNFRVK